MRPISSFLCDQEVILALNTWGTDLDGSRIVASTQVVDQVPAAVLPGKGQRRVDIEPESGNRRVTEFTPITIQFDSDACLHIDDTIAWTDAADQAHVYLVVAYGPVAGQSGAWVATCEERA
jgi:hypothetical protein